MYAPAKVQEHLWHQPEDTRIQHCGGEQNYERSLTGDPGPSLIFQLGGWECVWFANSEIKLSVSRMEPWAQGLSHLHPYQTHPDRIKMCLIAYSSTRVHHIHLTLGSEGCSCVTYVVIIGKYWAFVMASAGLIVSAYSQYASPPCFQDTSLPLLAPSLVIFRHMSLAWLLPKSTSTELWADKYHKWTQSVSMWKEAAFSHIPQSPCICSGSAWLISALINKTHLYI